MKKILKIISSLLIIVLLSGCGIFNLNNFTMPDDLEFLAVIESLDTPEKICDYMKDNFKYEKHYLYAPNPYVLWKIKEGDCNDFSTFGTFAANYHGYVTYQICITFTSPLAWHYIAVYEEDGEMAFSDNWIYTPMQKDNFAEIVDYDCWLQDKKLKSYKVYDYNRNIIEKGTNE